METVTPTNVAELLALPTAPKYLFFWGHRPQRDGSIGAGCLSQWWPVEFTVDGVVFRSAEHYMMWRKAELFGDHESARPEPVGVRADAGARGNGRVTS